MRKRCESDTTMPLTPSSTEESWSMRLSLEAPTIRPKLELFDDASRCSRFSLAPRTRTPTSKPPTAPPMIVAVMRAAGDGVHGRRLRGLIVVLWRAGLRIHEALALTEADLDARRGSLL